MRRSGAPSLLNKSNIVNKSISSPSCTSATAVLKEQNPTDNSTTISAYSILWAKRSTKKHKIWEGDGTLTISSKFAILRDDTGKYLGQIPIRPEEIVIGNRLVIGSNEIEIIESIPVSRVPKKRYSETTHILDGEDAVATSEQPSSKKIAINPSCFQSNLVLSNSMAIKLGFTITAPTNRPPKRVLDTIQSNESNSVAKCVMPEPSYEHQWKFNTTKQPIVEVSVCPSLASVLRPHQRDGIRFMYECIMGFRNLDNCGCILADEMGLGKTLQCIALCYTLLKQGPYGIPIVRKILIVTPSSLITNWDNEIQKWLQHERAIFTYQCDAKHKVDQFAGLASSNMPFLLISYEMFTKHSDALKNVSFDLIICDEGHRLKNQNVKAAILLNEIECKRRIILTGTPIQNDLQEFYALMSFVNGNLLGTYQEYKQQYEQPIVAAQKPDITPAVHDLGDARAKELNRISAPYILRRTQSIIEQFLPKKETIVIFCRPSVLQQNLLTTALEYVKNEETISNPLQTITVLKKICNHPSLIQTGSSTNETSNGLLSYMRGKLPDWNQMGPMDSGKLSVVYNLLDELDQRNEKIVLISYHTTTLDMLQGIIEHFNYKHCRLDGNTPTQMRGKIVDQFNDPQSDIFIFLLSAKAGGCGLNLIGASRLVMFDNDWNPASDIQAMSRIWRDGQKRNVYIYRLITMGTIEEKIFQRQLSKTTLSGCVVDAAGFKRDCLKFSDDELKDLFSIQPQQYAICATHELLSCDCNGDGENLTKLNSNAQSLSQPSTYKIDLQPAKGNSLKIDELSQWQHYKAPICGELLTDLCLSNCDDEINFIFRNQITSNTK